MKCISIICRTSFYVTFYKACSYDKCCLLCCLYNVVLFLITGVTALIDYIESQNISNNILVGTLSSTPIGYTQNTGTKIL